MEREPKATAPRTIVANENASPPQPSPTTVCAPSASTAAPNPPKNSVATAAITPKIPATSPMIPPAFFTTGSPFKPSVVAIGPSGIEVQSPALAFQIREFAHQKSRVVMFFFAFRGATPFLRSSRWISLHSGKARPKPGGGVGGDRSRSMAPSSNPCGKAGQLKPATDAQHRYSRTVLRPIEHDLSISRQAQAKLMPELSLKSFLILHMDNLLLLH